MHMSHYTLHIEHEHSLSMVTSFHRIIYSYFRAFFVSADVWNWDQMKSNKKRAKVRSELQQLQITLLCGSKMIHFTFNCIESSNVSEGCGPQIDLTDPFGTIAR